jgi:hypothetical protein
MMCVPSSAQSSCRDGVGGIGSGQEETAYVAVAEAVDAPLPRSEEGAEALAATIPRVDRAVSPTVLADGVANRFGQLGHHHACRTSHAH